MLLMGKTGGNEKRSYTKVLVSSHKKIFYTVISNEHWIKYMQRAEAART
jgi:hypothetical protein